MGDYRKLQVWERAHRLTLEVYKVTGALPREETYGLISQLRRASSSIPANIAEGCGRDSDAEIARFLRIAKGSAKELDYQLLLAHDLGYLRPNDYQRLSIEAQGVSRMLSTFIGRLRQSNNPQPPALSS